MAKRRQTIPLPEVPTVVPPEIGKKKPCTITRKAFVRSAQPLTVRVEDSSGLCQALTAVAREFSTGSFGWAINGKVEIMLPNGHPAYCQFNANFIVIGSKDAD